MRLRRFTWHGVPYNLDQATLTHWPDTRLIRPPETDKRMTPTHALFISFVTEHDCEPDETLPIQAQCDNAQADLVGKGYGIWSVPEAVGSVLDKSYSELSGDLVGGLEHWWFYKKIEPLTRQTEQ